MIGIAAAAAMIVLQSRVELGLSLSELPDYKAALEAREGSTGQPVSFGDLWTRPEAIRGRRVRVEGRIVRRFETAKTGELPARVELWLATPSEDVMCTVFPGTLSQDAVSLGHRISFVGTSLGLVHYAAGDVHRRAPLIVGSTAPKLLPEERQGTPTWGATRLDWVVGGIACVTVALWLARAHFRRPPRRLASTDPPVEFVDGAETPDLSIE